MKLNGNLVLNALGASEIQNAMLERVGSLPAVEASEKGRIVFLTTVSVFYFNDGTSWVAFATGGNAASLQTEVNAIETSLGDAIDAAGAFVGASFTGAAAGATSFTDAINQVADAIAGKDALAELIDVDVAGVVGGQVLQYNGATSKWEDHTLVVGDIPSITATAAELNILAGVTGVTAAELSYVGDVTGMIQNQLDNKQPLDATLSGVAALSGTGIVVETAADVFTNRTMVAPSEGITISNPAGILGNPTFALANDLAALEGLTTTGYVVRTGDGTATTRAMSVTSGDLVITGAADGVSTDTTFGLATVTQAASGDFVKVSLDTKGRVVGNTAVVTADITALVDGTYVNVSGDTMTGSLAMGNNDITGLNTVQNASPTSATSKAYVDALVAAGATWKNPVVDVDLVDLAGANPGTMAALATTFGLSIGANVSFIATAAFTFDAGGVTYAASAGDVVNLSMISGTVGNYHFVDALSAGDRFIIGAEHGSAAGIAAGALGTLVVSGAALRKGDLIEFMSGTGANAADWSVPNGRGGLSGGTPEIAQGVTVLCADPESVHYGHTYLYDATTNAWVEISGPGAIGAGTGLTYTGTVLNVGLGAGVRELPSDEVGIDLYDEPNGAIILTLDGSTHSTATGAKLYLRLDAAGALAQTSSGLKIDANSVTNAMIVNDTMVVNGDTGNGSLALGGTLEVKGTSTQGIITSVNGTGTFTITASDASASQKGVATFNTGDFSVTAGDVTIKAAGVDNAQLVNSSFTVTDGLTPQGIDLGGTLTVGATASTGITVDTTTADKITIAGIDASTTVKGVASFDAAHFSVATGAVSLAATLGDLTNVDAASADVTTAGTMLVNDGTDYKGRKVYFLYSGASATSHVVTHSLNQQYCNVTVVDALDEVIIPQSIKFDSASQLTVVFNTAIACKVVVMGV